MNDNIKIEPHPKSLLMFGAFAGPIFILAVLIQGVMQTDYNSLRYPLSSLSIGDSGWMQIANFIIAGTLLLIFSIGLKQVFNSSAMKSRGPLLIGLAGIGLIGAGLFVTDPIFGYPADKPLLIRQFTLHGHLHDAFSMLVFVCLPWACFVLHKHFVASSEHGWATYSAFTGFAMIITFIIASMGFKQLAGFVDFAGVFQRLCVATGLTWTTLLALHLSRPKNKFPREFLIRIEKRFNVPIEEVWKAWTDPLIVFNWFGSDPNGKVSKANLDVRPGGRFEVAFTDSDQTEHVCSGTYFEVEKFTKLTFSWKWKSEPDSESFVTVSLAPEGEVTKMKFQHSLSTHASKHDYLKGWNSTFLKLDRLLTSSAANFLNGGSRHH